MSSVLVRFAPSPTGRLHLGNARVAVLNWLFAHAHGGAMVLRLDDTDIARGTAEFAQAIRDDLLWLGLTWTREESQLARAARHAEAVDQLKAAGRLYACYETPEELEYRRRRQRAQGLPPIYDRAGLALSAAERAALEAEGRKPHWRFRLDHEETSWLDLARGPCHAHGGHLSDPVLVREDGSLLYTLPSVVDDIDFAISHVIRGEDHVVNTAVQIQICRALGAEPPHYAHLPLVLTAEGGGLSKRDNALSLGDLRAQGIEPAAINALLAALGTAEAPDPLKSLDELAQGFRLDAFGRAAPRLDPADLVRLSARIYHALSPSEARARGIAVSDALWLALRANLTTLSDLDELLPVVEGEITPLIAEEDRAMIDEAARLLPETPWDATTWATWTAAVKTATGRKGKGLFMPLRRALTGVDHGPELAALLPLIGRDKALARLRGEKA
ncbi:glutamate--tRNA ligase [Rhodospirillum rubrum]|uniref:Glutamate--tRNA ligase 1 n=1 Tax=Rhodospirillum rubrum (strain ATCC 11170 / ATH 1.1.1 / DSM 467 / LMG 4362 / NCIMB 8255 / S1) TaxID=269796 RepID=SYE1_RHORT|nr:glutamate--tRNA ligase [Rhodospirillum rubrum]Q2RWK3.1 RecName: Full=Glutamate--tRNA ligase 1; AltName: Full=Glutamyl-tRNA synthetase 1; Short=GluRS 1 [Rhodospirillum rubrum ATCC 11170]ABC21492.1 glutamyl-tRNA synthetase / glutamate--tRNA(Gln) ligase [Rhodospirillum rubrum ATCC 11170]AEO47175.1 glutamyl-tRNA synthetase [Rhodospirillum rubrum F11]MBK5953088.1 glutamate--tRNA ligase 1 [Rhodospirillum rubrum]QXG81166.1 glutamate--tRNA ligase [Rhodospirillum rubrum]HAQ01414.1 glutamate--tRNA l